MLGNVDAFQKTLSVSSSTVSSPTPPTTSTSSVVSLLAGEALGYPRAVVLNLGKLMLFDPSLYPQGSIVGLTKTSALVNSSVDVITSGELAYTGWGLMVNKTYYAGTAGILTLIPPANGVVQSVGLALGVDRLLIHPKSAISLI